MTRLNITTWMVCVALAAGAALAVTVSADEDDATCSGVARVKMERLTTALPLGDQGVYYEADDVGTRGVFIIDYSSFSEPAAATSSDALDRVWYFMAGYTNNYDECQIIVQVGGKEGTTCSDTLAAMVTGHGTGAALASVPVQPSCAVESGRAPNLAW